VDQHATGESPARASRTIHQSSHATPTSTVLRDHRRPCDWPRRRRANSRRRHLPISPRSPILTDRVARRVVGEALGGSLGSLAGIAVVGLSAGCGHENLECVILRVGAGGAVGAVGATVGTELAARYTGSKRSVLGAALGAVVGTGVGLGIHALLNQNSDRNLGDPIVVPIFVIAQGAFAAIGSRVLGGAR